MESLTLRGGAANIGSASLYSLPQGQAGQGLRSSTYRSAGQPLLCIS